MLGSIFSKITDNLFPTQAGLEETIHDIFSVDYFKDAVETVQMNPSNAGGVDIWSIVHTIYNAFLPIAIAFAVFYLVVRIVNNFTYDPENAGIQSFVAPLIQFLITIFVLNNAFEIITLMYGFMLNISKQVSALINNQKVLNMPGAVWNMILKQNVGENGKIEFLVRWRLWFEILPVRIIIWLPGIFIQAYVLAKVLNILVRGASAPIALADGFAQPGGSYFDSKSKRYLKSLFAEIMSLGVNILIIGIINGLGVGTVNAAIRNSGSIASVSFAYSGLIIVGLVTMFTINTFIQSLITGE